MRTPPMLGRLRSLGVTSKLLFRIPIQASACTNFQSQCHHFPGGASGASCPILCSPPGGTLWSTRQQHSNRLLSRGTVYFPRAHHSFTRREPPEAGSTSGVQTTAQEAAESEQGSGQSCGAAGGSQSRCRPTPAAAKPRGAEGWIQIQAGQGQHWW